MLTIQENLAMAGLGWRSRHGTNLRQQTGTFTYAEYASNRVMTVRGSGRGGSVSFKTAPNSHPQDGGPQEIAYGVEETSAPQPNKYSVASELDADQWDAEFRAKSDLLERVVRLNKLATRLNPDQFIPNVDTETIGCLTAFFLANFRAGAVQEVSPVDYVSEIHPDDLPPSCHVCGAEMVVKEWKCLSCKATTGVQEVSPATKTISSASIGLEPFECKCSCNPMCGCACHKRAEVEVRELRDSLNEMVWLVNAVQTSGTNVAHYDQILARAERVLARERH